MDWIWNQSAAEVRRIFFASSDSPTVTLEIARVGIGPMLRGSVRHVILPKVLWARNRRCRRIGGVNHR